MLRRVFLGALSSTLCATTIPALAAPTGKSKSITGRPEIHLNRLTLPADLPNAKELEAQLRRSLKKEARRADWGAGRDNRIEYRFFLEKLHLRREGDVLRVQCAAWGQLPGGQKAKSELEFGGAPEQKTQLIQRILDVVARGVITRLAELERQRRGLR